MAMMTIKEMDDWIASLPRGKQNAACDIYSAKSEEEQMRIKSNFATNVPAVREVTGYTEKSPGTQAGIMSDLSKIYTPSMSDEDLAKSIAELGLLSNDMSDADYYASLDKFRKYMNDYQARERQAKINEDRYKLAREIDENSFHVLSPIESLKKFGASDDKLGYVQNSILNNLFPVFTTRMQDNIRSGEGPTSWSEMNAGDIGALGADVGTAALLAGGGKVAAGAMRRATGKAARTTLMELMGAGLAGGTGAEIQTMAMDNLTQNDQDFSDYAINFLFGAGTNAIATPMLWKQAGDLVKNVAKGGKEGGAKILKTTADKLEGLGTSKEAAAGDYLSEINNKPTTPTTGYMSEQEANELRNLITEANLELTPAEELSIGNRPMTDKMRRKFEAQGRLSELGINPPYPDPSDIRTGYRVTPKTVLEEPYTMEGARTRLQGEELARDVRDGVAGRGDQYAVQEMFNEHEPIKQWYSQFNPNDTWLARHGSMAPAREVGSATLDLFGASPNAGWHEKKVKEASSAEEVQKAKENADKEEFQTRNTVMSDKSLNDKYKRWENGKVTPEEQHSDEYQKWWARKQLGIE